MSRLSRVGAQTWLSDFDANATLRFDPKTDQFTVSQHTRAPIPGRPGGVWLPEPGADMLVVIWE